MTLYKYRSNLCVGPLSLGDFGGKDHVYLRLWGRTPGPTRYFPRRRELALHVLEVELWKEGYLAKG